jgi:hypothetical protein
LRRSYTFPRQLTPAAWVAFVGTGTVTIRDSYNVSSITDDGTGEYTINWARPFGYAAGATGYAVFMAARVDTALRGICTINGALTIGNTYNNQFIRVRVFNNVPALADPSICTVTAYGP